MSADKKITKNNIDVCFAQLAKEYKKIMGRAATAEIILIGGAAILASYEFRELTYDIDAIIQAPSAMKDAINRTGDVLGLENEWLNTDFMKTTSFSPKLIQYSKYYKTFGNCITVRVVKGEYLLAMKLVSGRVYKNDLSDIPGIVLGERKQGNIIDYSKVNHAIQELYGGWDRVSENMKRYLEEVLSNSNLEEIYQRNRNSEGNIQSLLTDFERKNPNVVRRNNINEIIKQITKKQAENN